MKEICKRLVDLLLSIFLIIVLFPLYLSIFIVLFIEQLINRDFSPFIISEKRVSKKRVFNLYKLNMYRESYRQEYIKNSPEYKKYGTWSYLQKNPKAIRAFGDIMRKLYLDELGQFFNILKGDMSFVGPRPLPVGYELNDEEPRQLLKAGLVGFAANQSKNEGDTLVKQKTDAEYLELYKTTKGCKILKTDFLVIADGFRAVLKAKGH